MSGFYGADQIRHKVFISYHHADQQQVDAFIRQFDHLQDTFIARGLGREMPGDVIDSDDPEYVMRKIRELYLKDSTVTLVLVGSCTWARRYVDWEIQGSLRRPADGPPPNGLLGVVLPSAGTQPQAPERLRINLKGPNATQGYARWYYYPQTKSELASWIEDAFQARTARAHLIDNPRDRKKHNSPCP